MLAALPGGKDAARPQSAHGILQAAAAVAAEQPAPAEDLKAYRYTRVLTRFVDLVQVDDGDFREILQSSEVMEPPPTEAPRLENGERMAPWPPPIWLAARTEVYLSTGHLAAIRDRP